MASPLPQSILRVKCMPEECGEQERQQRVQAQPAKSVSSWVQAQPARAQPSRGIQAAMRDWLSQVFPAEA